MNIFAKFQKLIARPPTTVGLVTAHNADGTSTIQTPAGGSFRAKGQSVSVSSNAYVRDGVVIGAAPTLPTVIDTI